MGPDPAVAAVRRAVRPVLRELGNTVVVVACSGGPDSLALAGAAAFEARSASVQVHGLCVDHQLQAGSAEQAVRAQKAMQALGIAHTATVAVQVSGPGGPEAAARQARYAAVQRHAEQVGAAAVLLGHTLDDQAETVLLGLARGSGARSLAGMAASNGLYRRPLLGVSRAQVHRAAALMCAHAGLDPQVFPWRDPHNDDPAYLRVRVRSQVLPVMEQVLGGGAGVQQAGALARALARTAAQLREDADALDGWAHQAWIAAAHAQAPVRLRVEVLEGLPAAVLTRVLRRACVQAGCASDQVSAEHVGAIHALITDWHGQRGVSLPGARLVRRQRGVLVWGELAVE